MNDSTPVNSQITDAVTNVNIKVLGDAPAMALGNLFQSVGQAIQIAAHDATGNQPQSTETTQAATATAVNALNNLGQAPSSAAPRAPAPSE